MASTKSASGPRDLVSDEVRQSDSVIGVIMDVYESRGFDSFEGIEASFTARVDDDGKTVEAKAILAVDETLKRLGIRDFAIYISHSEVLAGILETVRVPPEVHKLTFAPISAFSKFNVEGFVNELREVGVSEKASTNLADLFLSTDAILNQEHDINRTVVTNLLNIVKNETLTELGQVLQLTGRTPVFIDPALACTEPYGPGIVIEARTSGLDVLGDGGCVEGNSFAFTFDIETIIELMDEGNSIPPTVSRTAAIL